jgi:hypothetical protein
MMLDTCQLSSKERVERKTHSLTGAVTSHTTCKPWRTAPAYAGSEVHREAEEAGGGMLTDRVT